ncbi:MAG: DUF4388 domain-containing protein [Thermodesulfobacteriota bacterium]|nr:DUF4388 domain-containing protein [Thermodesulfobacteriota bacterium]
MNLQGDFEGLTLASILQLLCNDQKTGVLRVTCEEEESRVFFEQGTIIYASSSLKEAKLGVLMRKDGILSAKHLQKCLALAREENIHLGKVLVEKGYISLDSLKKYNTRQVETILYNLLFWKKGRFEYKDTKLNLKGMIVIQLNPMKLILEASRRVDELSFLKELIPSDKLVFKMSGKMQSKEEIKLNANEWRILSLIDGTRTVRQVINESAYDEFAVYKILFSVISSGLIEQKEDLKFDDQEGGGDFSVIITIFNDILQVIKKHVVDELGDNRSYALFNEIKTDLALEYKDLFKDYHPDRKLSSNLAVITTALDATVIIDEPKYFLIMGFAEYATQVLKKIGNIIGGVTLNTIVNDVENVLGYVKKYQTGSKEKSKIVNDMTNVISEIRSEFTTGKKKSKLGIFSLFS